METFVDVYVNANGEKASVIFKKINEMGLKYHIGEHDFINDWKGIAKISDELELADRIQTKLRGTGAILKFTTIR